MSSSVSLVSLKNIYNLWPPSSDVPPLFPFFSLRFGFGPECIKTFNIYLWHLHSTQGLQPPEHLSSDLLHYADELPCHAGLLSHHIQESKLQPCLVTQYRSMFGLKYRSISDGRCRSTGDGCLRSTVVSEYRSTALVPGSTVVDENRATNKCCCR
ncbi:hypothetical protein F2Q68_00039187 [Brassica cretica]|uniref:Uncharacterized protein n=1 Tax=Brassica cretica TaxID=69181 RepID=A0A8S9MMY5_BRACR|nr:hypothetical protein F2Q68_00039187 [Brassica cretica]